MGRRKFLEFVVMVASPAPASLSHLTEMRRRKSGNHFPWGISHPHQPGWGRVLPPEQQLAPTDGKASTSWFVTGLQAGCAASKSSRETESQGSSMMGKWWGTQIHGARCELVLWTAVGYGHTPSAAEIQASSPRYRCSYCSAKNTQISVLTAYF